MATLGEVMLDVARLTSDVYDGAATGGATGYLLDTNMGAQAEQYAGGTCWITSGSASGDVLTIKTNTENRLTFVETATATIAAGVTYSVCGPVFSKKMLKQAVNWQLKLIHIPKTDSTLSAAGGVITLGTISDVRQVILDGTRNYRWSEVSGQIVFDSSDTSGDVELRYMGPHDILDESESINTAVNIKYLVWAAAAFLWRNYTQRVKRDDSTAIDMLNEALAEMARTKPAETLARDPHHGAY